MSRPQPSEKSRHLIISIFCFATSNSDRDFFSEFYDLLTEQQSLLSHVVVLMLTFLSASVRLKLKLKILQKLLIAAQAKWYQEEKFFLAQEMI